MDRSKLITQLYSIFKNNYSFSVSSDIELVKLNKNDVAAYLDSAGKISAALLELYPGIDRVQIINDTELILFEQDKEIPIKFIRNSRCRSINPRRMMKTCGYNGNSKIKIQYIKDYNEYNETFNEKFAKYQTYGDIPKSKLNDFYLSMFNLMKDNLSGKHKCALNVFRHIIPDYEYVKINICKKRFHIYRPRNVEVTSMTLSNKKQTLLKFNSKYIFSLKPSILKTQIIDEKIKMLFNVSIENMSDLYRTNTYSF